VPAPDGRRDAVVWLSVVFVNRDDADGALLRELADRPDGEAARLGECDAAAEVVHIVIGLTRVIVGALDQVAADGADVLDRAGNRCGRRERDGLDRAGSNSLFSVLMVAPWG